MKITRISIAILPNMGVFQLMIDVLAFLDKKNLTEMQIEEAVNNLKTDLKALDESLVQENLIKNPLGMNEAEHLRDLCIRKLCTALAFFAEGYPNNEKNEAAQTLLEIVQRYGGTTIATMPQPQESAVITNLLQEIETEAMDAKVKTLHIEDLTDALKTHNNAFIAIKQERDTDNALAAMGKTKAARAKTEKSFKNLCERINAYITLGDGEKYAETVETLNHLLKIHLDSAMLSRKTKKKKPEETEEERN